MSMLTDPANNDLAVHQRFLGGTKGAFTLALLVRTRVRLDDERCLPTSGAHLWTEPESA